MRNFTILASLCICAGRFEHDIVANPEDRFSRNDALCKCMTKPTKLPVGPSIDSDQPVGKCPVLSESSLFA